MAFDTEDSPVAEWPSEDRSLDNQSEHSGDNNDTQPKASPPTAPPLPEKQLVSALFHELQRVIAGNSKFDAFDHNQAWESAEKLVQYGIISLESFRTTDGQARKYLFEDLRKTEKLPFREIALILKLNKHIPPNDQKVTEKNIRFTELDIPKALTVFRPNLSELAASFHPEQEMVNWIVCENLPIYKIPPSPPPSWFSSCNRQRAAAAAKGPPYVPYLLPKLTEPPWMLPSTDHSGARANWVAYSRQARRANSPQELSIQSFTLYHLRYLFAADLCKAFENFGGLAHQLSHLSTILNLAILESVGTALAYHRILSTKLQERARQRSAKLSDFTELLSGEDFTIKEQAKREIASAVEKDKREQLAAREQATRSRQNANNKAPPPNRNRSRSRTPAREQPNGRNNQTNRAQQNLPTHNARQNQNLRYGFNQRSNNAPANARRQQR